MSTKKKLLEAAAGNAGEAVYVDDVFSCFVYQGNNTTNQIVNGINLAGKGGLVWQKARSTYSADHLLTDSVRGRTQILKSNSTAAEVTANDTHIASFNSDGFTLGYGYTAYENFSGITDGIMSWTFRKQPGFFDVVTYTGNGIAGTEIAHNLGSVPGMIIVKLRSSSGGWIVFHRSRGNTKYLQLNSTNAEATQTWPWNNTSPTDTHFTVGASGTNDNGQTYVAYLFAHDAQDFGTNEDESIIKCGSYTGNGTATNGPVITLGWEPQWVMIKAVNPSLAAGCDWEIFDSIRGLTANYPNDIDPPLEANSSSTESSAESVASDIAPLSTGFQITQNGGRTLNESGTTYIYVAIRRPMKPPESGTEVFNIIERTGTGSAATVTGVGFALDAVLGIAATVTLSDRLINDRLRGVGQQLLLNNTNAEATAANGYDYTGIDYMDGFSVGLDQYGKVNYSGASIVNYCFKRAPGFFDIVAYNGGSNPINHGLGVTPEMILVRRRDGASVSAIYHEATGLSNNWDLPSNGAVYANPTYTAVSATSFSGQTSYTNINYTGMTYVAYLFATLPGISKVGSYTGTGSNLDVDCGFTSGARFVLIKRNGAGDWYIYDSERGIVAGNDPYLFLNTTAAGVTSTDYIDPLSSGFTITSSAPAALNSSGDTYIFLAIA